MDTLQTGTETILLVDDEALILNLGKEMLTELGYTVIAVSSGEEALKVFAEAHDRIDLVIMDMIMPRLGGGELYDRLRAIDAGLRAILTSGYSADGKAADILSKGCDGFIQKPFGFSQLAAKVREVLDKPGTE